MCETIKEYVKILRKLKELHGYCVKSKTKHTSPLLLSEFSRLPCTPPSSPTALLYTVASLQGPSWRQTHPASISTGFAVPRSPRQTAGFQQKSSVKKGRLHPPGVSLLVRTERQLQSVMMVQPGALRSLTAFPLLESSHLLTLL